LVGERTELPGADLEELARRHPREIYRLVRHFVDDSEEALDLAQEVFLRAFAHRQGFRSESAFTTWLYRVALNLCHNERRKRARRQAREVLLPEALDEASETPSALETLIARESSERIDHLVQALPTHEFVAVVLHYYSGLSQKQVAEVVHASLSAVESRLRRALARLQSWLESDEGLPAVPDAGGQRFLTVGRILLKLRDPEAALPYCERAAALLPEDVSALCALGSAYWQVGNLDGAWEMAQRALRTDPDAGQAHNLCGIVHGTRGEHSEAITAFHHAAADARWPERVRAYGNLGVTYVYMRRWDEAARALEQAVALDPHYALAYSHLGNVYLEQGRHEEALRCQDRATAFDPPYFQGHFNRGAVLAAMGRTEEAIASYRRASQLAPWWIDAHAELGLLLHAQDKREEAEIQFDTVLALRGGGGQGAYYRGRVHLVRGHQDAALTLFEEAAREAPEWAEPLLGLAQVHEARGDLPAAVEAVRQALQREPQSAEARERLSALEEQAR